MNFWDYECQKSHEAYNLAWGPDGDDITVWATTHHPFDDGKPYGMEIRVIHNKTKDKWIHMVPATGSIYTIITEEQAKQLMEAGATIIYETSGSRRCS